MKKLELRKELLETEEIELNFIDDNIVINCNNNIIKITYDNDYRLYVKSDLLDSELITNESTIIDDIKTLINLYKE